MAIFLLFLPMMAILYGGNSENFGTFLVVGIVAVVMLVLLNRLHKRTMPGGARGAKIQGIWVLKKHLKFNPALRKYESLSVDKDKNYFEFKGKQFRSGDFEEDGKQLPAEWSSFSIEGNNVIFGSEFLKKAHWTWVVDEKQLELTAETAEPKASKSQFIFVKNK